MLSSESWSSLCGSGGGAFLGIDSPALTGRGGGCNGCIARAFIGRGGGCADAIGGVVCGTVVVGFDCTNSWADGIGIGGGNGAGVAYTPCGLGSLGKFGGGFVDWMRLCASGRLA